MLLNKFLEEPRTQLPILLREPWVQLTIFLGDSMTLREAAPKQHLLNNGQAQAQLEILLQNSKNLGKCLVCNS
jgi:hypothetical protein